MMKSADCALFAGISSYQKNSKFATIHQTANTMKDEDDCSNAKKSKFDKRNLRLIALHNSLKAGASRAGIGISEQDIQKDPAADASAFFERLKPLESFAGVNSDDYVRAICSKSRIFRWLHFPSSKTC